METKRKPGRPRISRERRANTAYTLDINNIEFIARMARKHNTNASQLINDIIFDLRKKCGEVQ